MYVGNVEFKEVRIFSNGKADIIMEKVGGSDYYAETYKWRYDGKYLSFTKGNTTYQFQITGYLWPSSSCVTLTGNTHGLSAEAKIVSNKTLNI
jgi:hypothetical protein